MRCKACDSEMDTYIRTIELETGEKVSILEDLCSYCRMHLAAAWHETDTDLSAFGVDIEED